MSKNRPDLPPLAQYKPINEYLPKYGDVIVWSGWFTTWFGVVNDFDANTGELSIIFAGMPFLLFTLKETEQTKAIRKIHIDKIQGAAHGTFAAQQHDYTRNAGIWYI